MSKTDNEPRHCPGCGDVIVPHTATVSRKDTSTFVCRPCGTFETVALSVGDRLVSPGFAVRKDKHDREQFNRRTGYSR